MPAEKHEYHHTPKHVRPEQCAGFSIHASTPSPDLQIHGGSSCECLRRPCFCEPGEP